MIHKIIPVSVRDGKATLTTYVLENFPEIDLDRRRPAIIICPGGSYRNVTERESEAVAIKMNSFGFQAFILRYSVVPYEFPQALLELAQTIKLVRSNIESWMLDPNKIFVAGFSAGGHLVASLGAFWQEEFLWKELEGEPVNWRPDGLMLGYPAITSGKYAHSKSLKTLLGSCYGTLKGKMSLENQIHEGFPPTFLWHTVTDKQVPVENSLLLAQSLRKARIPFSLHLFSSGGHGISLANEETSQKSVDINQEISVWPDLFIDWVKQNYIL